MIACFYPADKFPHKKIVKNFALGLGNQAKVYPISVFLRNKKLPAGTTSVAFAGIIRGFGDLYKFCLRERVPFYYIDHSYFNPGYNTVEEWMRITKNNFLQNSVVANATPNKFNKYFPNVSVQPWKEKRGEHILLIPPTDSVNYVFGTHNWQHHAELEIKKHTDRPIKIREKESKLILNPDGSIKGWTKLHYSTTLAQDLNNAHCVVAYNSNVAVDAAIAGIPVFTSDNCAAYPISNAIKDIEDPYFKQRDQWVWSLANSQFTRREMINGNAFEYLGKL